MTCGVRRIENLAIKSSRIDLDLLHYFPFLQALSKFKKKRDDQSVMAGDFLINIEFGWRVSGIKGIWSQENIPDIR